MRSRPSSAGDSKAFRFCHACANYRIDGTVWPEMYLSELCSVAKKNQCQVHPQAGLIRVEGAGWETMLCMCDRQQATNLQPGNKATKHVMKPPRTMDHGSIDARCQCKTTEINHGIAPKAACFEERWALKNPCVADQKTVPRKWVQIWRYKTKLY